MAPRSESPGSLSDLFDAWNLAVSSNGSDRVRVLVQQKVCYFVVMIVIAICLLAYGRLFAPALRAPGLLVKKMQRVLAVAIQSSVVFVGVISVPLLIDDFRNNSRFAHWLMELFAGQYEYLPFWMAFLLAANVGDYLNAAWHSIIGTGVAVIALTFLNSLFPGGASIYSASPEALAYAWFPGGYSPTGALVFTALFVLYIFTSTWSVTFKQYCLGFYGANIASFMNPASSAKLWDQVMFDTDRKLVWDTPVELSVYIIALAVPLAGLSIVMVPCLQRNRRFFSSKAQAAKGYRVLVQDTWGALERIVKYFRDDGQNFDIDSTSLYLRDLGRRRTHLEAALESGRWEKCYLTGSGARTCNLWKVNGLLCNLRQTLRVLMEITRIDRLRRSVVARSRIMPCLERFLKHYGAALGSLTRKGVVGSDVDNDTRDYACEQTHLAEDAVLEALTQLEADSPQNVVMEQTFLDCLRTSCAELHRFLETTNEICDVRTKRSVGTTLRRYCTPHTWCSKDQLTDGMRNLTSWMLAIAWCVFYADYRSSCLTCVSFVFSPDLGSLFDRSMNRMVGVALGQIFGNLPGILLEDSLRMVDGKFVSHTAVSLYLCMIMIMWCTAVYGYLAPRPEFGMNFSYASLLWAGFGGVQMLKRLSPYRKDNTCFTNSICTTSTNCTLKTICATTCSSSCKGNACVTSCASAREELYYDVMDNFLGCMIVLLVDLSFARFFGKRVTDEVAFTLPVCFENLASIVEGLRSHICKGSVEEKVGELKANIAQSRHWDKEVKKMDLAWNGRISEPYRQELVAALLDKLDNAYVASWSILTSSERVSDSAEFTRILRHVLPETDETQWLGCAELARKTLRKSGNDESSSLPPAGLPQARPSKTFDGSPAFHDFIDHEFGDMSDRYDKEKQGQADTPEVNLLASKDAHSVGARAASNAVRTKAWALRRTLTQVQVLLEEHAKLVALQASAAELFDASSDESLPYSDDDDDNED